MPIQLKHTFSNKYISIKENDVSKDPGNSILYLSESTDECSFFLQPNEKMEGTGLVINFSDYFHIQSSYSKTPFFLHVMNGNK